MTINNSRRVVHLSAAGEYLGEWACEGEAAGIAAGPEGLLYLANGAAGRVEAWR